MAQPEVLNTANIFEYFGYSPSQSFDRVVEAAGAKHSLAKVPVTQLATKPGNSKESLVGSDPLGQLDFMNVLQDSQKNLTLTYKFSQNRVQDVMNQIMFLANKGDQDSLNKAYELEHKLMEDFPDLSEQRRQALESRIPGHYQRCKELKDVYMPAATRNLEGVVHQTLPQNTYTKRHDNDLDNTNRPSPPTPTPRM